MYFLINQNYHKSHNKKATAVCSSVANTFSCYFFTLLFLNNMLLLILLTLSLPVLGIIYHCPAIKNEKLALQITPLLHQHFISSLIHHLLLFIKEYEDLTVLPNISLSSQDKVTFFVKLRLSVQLIIPTETLFAGEPHNILLLKTQSRCMQIESEIPLQLFDHL